ncbi:MAG: hypothetical protein LBH18_05670 [Spirochaetaceae bacterium]|nr:hypothetical protein [Spirochaetaceae bacterium]
MKIFFAAKRIGGFAAAINLFFLLLCSCLSGKSPVVPVFVEEESKAVEEAPLYTERDVSGVFFMPSEPPPARIPSDVGIVSGRDLEKEGADGAELSFLFRRAYWDALMRDMPLLDVLGIDRVHRWPENSNLTWTQNWRSAETSFNSWGIPGLVLAILSGGGVFTVSGDILDVYGKTMGLDGANGALGYGSPRGSDFLMRFTDYTLPTLAQRFDNGLIYINSMGRGSFIAEKAPSDIIELSETVGFYADGDDELRQTIETMFRRAYKGIIDRQGRGLKVDGLVEYASFGGNVHLVNVAGDLFSVMGFFVQYYGNGRFAAVLSFALNDAGRLVFPLDARVIEPPFAEVLLYAVRLPSASGLSPDPFEIYADTREIVKSFALYGIPLTDSFVSVNRGSLSQRFSKGVFHSNMP